MILPHQIGPPIGYGERRTRDGQALAADIIDVLTDLFLLRGIPAWIRSDNGPEFVAKAARLRYAPSGCCSACNFGELQR